MLDLGDHSVWWMVSFAVSRNVIGKRVLLQRVVSVEVRVSYLSSVRLLRFPVPYSRTRVSVLCWMINRGERNMSKVKVSSDGVKDNTLWRRGKLNRISRYFKFWLCAMKNTMMFIPGEIPCRMSARSEGFIHAESMNMVIVLLGTPK